MKRLFNILLMLIICISLFSVSFADIEYTGRVEDHADILSIEEEASLLDKANKLSDKHKADITVLTAQNVDMSYAYFFLEDYCTANLNQSNINLILFIGFDEEGRYAQVDVFNDNDTKIADNELVAIREAIQAGSEDKSYHDRLIAGLNEASDRFRFAQGTDFIILGFFPMSKLGLMAGLILAIVFTAILILKHNASNKKTTATVYLDNHTIDILNKNDRYVRTDHRVSRGYYKKSSSSGGGGGGGHRSSGGGRF